MKTILTLIATAALGFAAIGCTPKEDEPAAPATGTTATPAPKTGDAAKPDTTKTGADAD
jgi:hypothetical protein